MSGTDTNTSLARALVDEWARAGVREAALAPGSRSAPLALALAGDGRIGLSVFLDERSASFFALGAAKASGRPAVVVCTSGTAAANLHPAVVEAWHARVPLIVCTADRPPELRDTGAGQAIDQLKLFGDAVRWFGWCSLAQEMNFTAHLLFTVVHKDDLAAPARTIREIGDYDRLCRDICVIGDWN